MKVIIDTDLAKVPGAVVVDNVASVAASSEDGNFPASNMRNDYTTDKWKAADGVLAATLTLAVSKGSAVMLFNTNAKSAVVSAGRGAKYELENSHSVSGTVTLANTRLSLVNAAAFFDASGPFLGHIGAKLTLTDSAGKKAIGYIKAVGTGETYGSDLLNGWDLTVGWSHDPNCGITDADTFTMTATSGMVYKSILTVGGLYKTTVDFTPSQGTVTVRPASGTAVYFTGDQTDKYFTCMTDACWAVRNIGTANGQTCDIASQLVKQVTAPSATGVTITSTPNGSTYNWASIEAGFKYNDASGYTWEISEINYELQSGYELEDSESYVTTVYDLPGYAGRLWAEYPESLSPHLLKIALTADSTLEAGIVRAGVVEEFNDPLYGIEEGSIDYSIEQELNNGALYYRKRNVVRAFESLEVIETRANCFVFKHDVFDAVGPKPLAVRLVHNNITDDEFILFAKRIDPPQIIHDVSSTRSRLEFNLQEVV